MQQNHGLSPILVGATERPLDLGATGAAVLLSVDPAGCQALAAALADAVGPHRGKVTLSLEAITGKHPANLAVYLGPPAGAAPATSPGQRAGVLGLYGLSQANEPDEAGGGGGGVGFSLDVSEVVARSRLAGPPVPATIRVSIVPTRPIHAGAQIQIGRIRLVYLSPT